MAFIFLSSDSYLPKHFPDHRVIRLITLMYGFTANKWTENGTNRCHLAVISFDGGSAWHYVVPTPIQAFVILAIR